MNNNNQVDQQLKKLRQEIKIQPQQRNRLLLDRKKLMERVYQYNDRAVTYAYTESWQHSLLYLEQAESLMELAANKGHLIDKCLLQCIFNNEAKCFQNLRQLQQCSSYIEALIFNLNSKNQSSSNSPSTHHLHKEKRLDKLNLAQYYLQFCAINSKLQLHSGALIAARKSLNLMKNEMRQWRKYLQKREKIRSSNENEQKWKLIHIVSEFNDHINLNSHEVIIEATSYYLKQWKINASYQKNMSKQLRKLLENFSIKSVMTLSCLTYQDCKNIFEREVQISILSIMQRIFNLSACYFTIATELRLISMKKSRQSNSEIIQKPEFKQSQIYHLLSILILALTITYQSPYLNYLLSSFQANYSKNLYLIDADYNKIFNQVIFLKEERNLQPSIESDHEEDLLSHLSKGGTMIRITKGSKESDRGNKFSLIEPKSKNKKLKNKKSKQKKKKSSTSIKVRNLQSFSKSPTLKATHSKQSFLMKSPKSKDSKSPITSIKLISGPVKVRTILTGKPHQKDKTSSKSKRKPKIQQNFNEYFHSKKVDQKKTKKTSVSTKKTQSHSHPRTNSTVKLPINSTLQTKDNVNIKQKKKGKKTILQHYL